MRTSHSITGRVILIAPVLLAVMVGCNTASRRAEKAMDLSIRMEDKFLEVAGQALINPSKEDTASLEKAKLDLRAGRARLRSEATGDALVIRCAERMDDLDKGIDGMEGGILNKLRLQLANDQRMAKFWGEQRALAGLPASYKANAELSFQKAQTDIKDRSLSIEAGEQRCRPLEAYRTELCQTKTQILELLPAR